MFKSFSKEPVEEKPISKPNGLPFHSIVIHSDENVTIERGDQIKCVGAYRIEKGVLVITSTQSVELTIPPVKLQAVSIEAGGDVIIDIASVNTLTVDALDTIEATLDDFVTANLASTNYGVDVHYKGVELVHVNCQSENGSATSDAIFFGGEDCGKHLIVKACDDVTLTNG